MSYYDGRQRDPVRGWKTVEDDQREAEIAELLSAAWGCQLHKWGPYAPLDWWASRDGQVLAVIEAKSRSHASTDHQTVWLNWRKFAELGNVEERHGVKAVFVVQFTDGLFFVPWREIDGTQHCIGGFRERFKSASDIEPMVEVPVASMKRISPPASSLPSPSEAHAAPETS